MNDMAWAVEFKDFVYRIVFDCERCGNCCRNIEESDKGKILVREGTTICQYFQEPNICTIYKNRPECCKKFPVFAGGEMYKYRTCPEYRRYSLFLSRRAQNLFCGPYSWYKEKRKKKKRVYTIYSLRIERLTRGLLTGYRIPVPRAFDEIDASRLEGGRNKC